jgi:hypothetical protein
VATSAAITAGTAARTTGTEPRLSPLHGGSLKWRCAAPNSVRWPRSRGHLPDRPRSTILFQVASRCSVEIARSDTCPRHGKVSFGAFGLLADARVYSLTHRPRVRFRGQTGIYLVPSFAAGVCISRRGPCHRCMGDFRPSGVIAAHRTGGPRDSQFKRSPVAGTGGKWAAQPPRHQRVTIPASALWYNIAPPELGENCSPDSEAGMRPFCGPGAGIVAPHVVHAIEQVMPCSCTEMDRSCVSSEASTLVCSRRSPP